MKKAKITVTGLVQGVYFRYHSKMKADELGLAGTVQNLATGQVRIVAEGEEERLEDLITWCRTGPRGSDVERVDIEWEDSLSSPKGFSILY
jgi:acylphosphatase